MAWSGHQTSRGWVKKKMKSCIAKGRGGLVICIVKANTLCDCDENWILMGRATRGGICPLSCRVGAIGQKDCSHAEVSLATACTISALHHWIYLWGWLALTCVCMCCLVVDASAAIFRGKSWEASGWSLVELEGLGGSWLDWVRIMVHKGHGVTHQI